MRKIIFSSLAVVMLMVGAFALTASAAEEETTESTTVSQSCTCEQTEPTTQSGCTCSDSSDDCCHVKDNNCCDCNQHHKQAVCSNNQNNSWSWEWNIYNIIGVILLGVGFLVLIVGEVCTETSYHQIAWFVVTLVGAAMMIASLILIWNGCIFI